MQEAEEDSGDYAPCAYCGRKIWADVAQCPYCGNFTDGAGPHGAEGKERRWRYPLWVVLTAIVLVLVLLWPLIWTLMHWLTPR